jgi:hypothetical protein
MKPNIVITCIDHTNNHKYINVLRYWLYKYHLSNTEANVILLSDTKTDFSSFKKPSNIEHVKFDLDYDKDYQEIKKKYISCKNKWYNHNMVISDILRFGKMPSMVQNLLIIDLDAIVENAINIPDDILLKPMAGCDHATWEKKLNIGFTYVNTNLGPEFLNKVINSNFHYPWFCETLISDIWINKYHIKFSPEYNWLVGLYGFNPKAYVNHYWESRNSSFPAKKMLEHEVNDFMRNNNDSNT